MSIKMLPYQEFLAKVEEECQRNRRHMGGVFLLAIGPESSQGTDDPTRARILGVVHSTLEVEGRSTDFATCLPDSIVILAINARENGLLALYRRTVNVCMDGKARERLLRVARTVADLEDAEIIQEKHISEAASFAVW